MSGGRAEGDGHTPAASVALIVGPGDRFLSGVSYYTALLTSALAERGPVAMLLLRRLCPRAVYPGRARVGSTDGALPLPDVPVFNGLDWFWGSSALGTWRFWRRIRPTAVILQWWTGTVLHSYLALAWLAKRAGARLVVEFHEVQDVGEARLPLVRQYTWAGMRLLLSCADAVVVHSEFDRLAIREIYPQVADLPIEVIPHGPYAHHTRPRRGDSSCRDIGSPVHHPPRPGEPVRLLIFGVIRPYKGHAELANAVRLLTMSGLDIHVSVVGEVWQGYREPLAELATILPADRLTVVDRYVTDAEVSAFFAAAHLVVLPYLRASASGPLHIAMSCGLPVVTTSVGGLVEATAGYTGAVLVPPNDPAALAEGIRTALPLAGRTHADPHSWERNAELYAALLDRIDAGWSGGGRILGDQSASTVAGGGRDITGCALRVGLVVPRFAPFHGGVETYTAGAAAALAAKGAKITVVTQVPRGGVLPAHELHDGYAVERHNLPLRHAFDVPSLSAARAAWGFGRFDVLWLHSYHTPLAWLAAERAKVPIVLTPHYHGIGHTRVREALHRVYRPAGRRLMAASRLIVVDTDAEADQVLRDFPHQVHRDKITVVPVAVDDPVGGRQPYPSEWPIVLTVARQEPYKRTDLLIRAVVELRRRAVPARLVVVGEGSCLAACQELAERLSAQDLVRFTGLIDEETLGRWWASASLYATASRQEAFGIGLAQALVAGLPVVASGIPAHCEVIRRAGSAALAELCPVDAPDIDSASRYADAIARLLSSRDGCMERAARCALPGAAQIADRLLETLALARTEPP